MQHVQQLHSYIRHRHLRPLFSYAKQNIRSGTSILHHCQSRNTWPRLLNMNFNHHFLHSGSTSADFNHDFNHDFNRDFKHDFLPNDWFFADFSQNFSERALVVLKNPITISMTKIGTVEPDTLKKPSLFHADFNHNFNHDFLHNGKPL